MTASHTWSFRLEVSGVIWGIHWGHIGIMEKERETTRFRVQGYWKMETIGVIFGSRARLQKERNGRAAI